MPSDPTSIARYFKGKRSESLLGELDPSNVPTHVAIIMDGNGRWAARRGLPRAAGHRAGAKTVREIVAAAMHLGIRCLTIYSFSSENWSRPSDEVSALMDLFVEVVERELEALREQGVRVRQIGRTAQIPPKTLQALRSAEEKTKDNDALTLLVALNYGGRTELVDAVRALAEEVADGGVAPDAIEESDIARYLYAPDVPDPDLLIRTSGEMRVSNFLLWQIAYSEIWVTSVLWPDFKRHDLLRAVVDYQHRSRRFGGN